MIRDSKFFQSSSYKQKNLHLFLIFLFFFSFISFPLKGSDPHQTQEQISFTDTSLFSEALAYAQENLSTEGKLIVKSDGFGYIKVDDAYIHTLFPMLGIAEEGYEEPPYFRSNEAPGAHISVFYLDENIWPEEVNQTFRFQLKKITIVNPSKTASYVILEIESDELESLRVKYGLSPKLHEHEFHISLAKKTIKSN